MVADEDMTLDMDEFNRLREEQKVRAREARKALGDLAWAGIDLGLDNTPTTFVGYTENNCSARVLAVCVGEEVSGTIAGGEEGIIVLDKTPFYAEMGGQVADQGVILVGNSRFQVTNVQKDKGGKYLHYGKMVTGSIKVDDEVCAATWSAVRQLCVPTPRHTCCRRLCRPCWAIMCIRPVPMWSLTACALTSPITLL